MKNLFAIATATAFLAACGGGVTQNGAEKGTGSVSVDGYAFPAPVANSVLAVRVVVTDQATPPVPVAGSPFVVQACTTAIKTNCWQNASSGNPTGKLIGFTLSLPPGNYQLSVQMFSDTAATALIGTTQAVKFTVVAGQSKSVTINNTASESSGGAVFTSLVYPSVVQPGDPATTFTATAWDPVAGVSVPVVWAVQTTTPAQSAACIAALTVATGAFTPPAAADTCKYQVSATIGAQTTTRKFTVQVGNNVTAAGTDVPTPIIQSITFSTNNPIDPAAQTISQSGGSWSGVSTAFAGPYTLTNTPLAPNDANGFPTGAQTYFGIFQVQYDLNGGGIDGASPPAVSVSAACTNDAADFTAGTPPVAITRDISINPGSIIGPTGCVIPPAVGVPCDQMVSDLGWWPESIGTNITPGNVSVCTFTVTVNNRGSADSINVYAAFKNN